MNTKMWPQSIETSFAVGSEMKLGQLVDYTMMGGAGKVRIVAIEQIRPDSVKITFEFAE